MNPNEYCKGLFLKCRGDTTKPPLTGMASPVSLAMRAGTSRRFISSAMSLPDALSRTNFFPARCSPPSRWTGLSSGMAILRCEKTGLVVPLAFVTRWQNTHAVVLTWTLTGLFRPGYRITCFQRARYATFSARIFTRKYTACLSISLACSLQTWPILLTSSESSTTTTAHTLAASSTLTAQWPTRRALISSKRR